MNTEDISFAITCRTCRTLLGWSQKELADRAEMAMASINRLERGSNPTMNTVRKIVRLFQDAGLEVIQDQPRGGFTLVASAEVIERQVDSFK
jgi:transcriptional regulator with XRE-family HTH domain